VIDLLCANAILIGLIGATYCVRRGIRVWRDDDYRTRNDRVMAERTCRADPPAIDTAPGTDTDLLLDCIAIAGDHTGFQRLRDAIHEAREEKP
jgi:hypothetical protein